MYSRSECAQCRRLPYLIWLSEMVCFRENITDGGEEDDLDLRSSSAEEGSSGIDESVSSETSGLVQRSETAAGGLGESFADAPAVGGDGDLFLACDELERGVLQWLRALDLHVIGACRVDERLKPLFKLNISSGIAEDRLVAQLSQVDYRPRLSYLSEFLACDSC